MPKFYPKDEGRLVGDYERQGLRHVESCRLIKISVHNELLMVNDFRSYFCITVYFFFYLLPIRSALSRNELEAVFIPYDLKRLEMYSRNMVDYHLIMDMIPTTSRMYFLNKFGDMSLSATQAVRTTYLTTVVLIEFTSFDDLPKGFQLIL